MTLLLVCCGCLFFSSCRKNALQDLESLTTLKPITIQTEACFSPTCMTLIVGYLDEDNLFTEIDDRKHQVVWHKNDQLLSNSKSRLDCTRSGQYFIQVIYRELDITKELQYSLNLESPF